MIVQIIVLIALGILCIVLLCVGVKQIGKREVKKGFINIALVLILVLCVSWIGSIYKYKVTVETKDGRVIKEYYNVTDIKVDSYFGNSVTFYDLLKRHWLIENHPQKVEQDGNDYIIIIGQ